MDGYVRYAKYVLTFDTGTTNVAATRRHGPAGRLKERPDYA